MNLSLCWSVSIAKLSQSRSAQKSGGWFRSEYSVGVSVGYYLEFLN